MAVHEHFWRIARPRSHFLGAVQVLGRPSASQRKKRMEKRMPCPSFSSFVDSLSGRTGALSSSSSLIRQCLADLITIRDGSALIDRSITRIEPSKSKSQRLADAIMLRAALSIRQRYDVTITAMVHSPGGWQIGDVQVPAGLTSRHERSPHSSPRWIHPGVT